MWLWYQIHRHGGKAICTRWTGFLWCVTPWKPLNILHLLQNCHKEIVDVCWQLLTQMTMKQRGWEPKQSLLLWPFQLWLKSIQEATQNNMSYVIYEIEIFIGTGELQILYPVRGYVERMPSLDMFPSWLTRECRQLARRPEHANVQTRLLKDNPHQSSAVNINRIYLYTVDCVGIF